MKNLKVKNFKYDKIYVDLVMRDVNNYFGEDDE